MHESRDDFYVGYLPEAPPELAKVVRSRVTTLLVVIAVLALVITLTQRPFDRSVFEFGTTRSFEGILQEHPYPALRVERPGGGTSSYLLTAFGKFGGNTLAGIPGNEGRRARVDGTLVYRDDQTMIEVTTVEVLPSDPEPLNVDIEDLGMQTFRGEIVDSKCFLGVMNPGNLKTHRACAVRCISGGVPPVLLVRESGDIVSYLLLTDAQGQPVNDRVLDLVAEPIEITGRLLRMGDRLILQSNPDTYQRDF